MIKNTRQLLAGFLAVCLLHGTVQPAAAAALFRVSNTPVRTINAPVFQISPVIAAPTARGNVALTQALLTPSLVTAAGLTQSVLPTVQPFAIEAPIVPTAQGMLEQMGSVDVAKQGSSELSRFYTGERGLSGDKTLSVLGSNGSRQPSLSFASRGSNLDRKGGSHDSFLSSSNSDSPRGPKKALMIIAGIVAAIGIIIGIIYHNSQKQNEVWQDSKSNQQIVLIEQYRRAGNADSLVVIVKDARERQARMAERIAAAKSSGSKKVDDKTGDDLKTAEAYHAFDGLAAARGELNLNAVSQKPDQRIGEQLLLTWKSIVTQEEAKAKATGQEGRLALQLKAMKAELGREDRAAARLGNDIKTFDEHVPGMFGGRLKEMSQKGQADLNEFKTTEVTPEQALYERVNASMRDRVSAKLMTNSPEYQKHMLHLDKLTAAEGQVAAALVLARQVDKDLADMAEYKRMEMVNLALAAANENVVVNDYDKDGNVVGSHTEDHSGTWKTMAALNASQAAASAASAKAGVNALSVMMPNLRKDKTLREEGLAFALPNGTNNTRIDGGNSGVFFDFFLPASWSFFGSVFSQDQANQARGSFGVVLGSLETVDKELKGRQAGETGWVNQQIDKDINQQMSAQK